MKLAEAETEETLPTGSDERSPDKAKPSRVIPFKGTIPGGIQIGAESEMALFRVSLQVPRNWLITALIQHYGTATELVRRQAPPDEMIVIANVSMHIPTAVFFNSGTSSDEQTGLGFKRRELLKHFPELSTVLPESGPITLLVDFPTF
jgi:hypothetical protein